MSVEILIAEINSQRRLATLRRKNPTIQYENKIGWNSKQACFVRYCNVRSIVSNDTKTILKIACDYPFDWRYWIKIVGSPLMHPPMISILVIYCTVVSF
jgi:hypothetical protein